MPIHFTLVTGGARSGKSQFAVELAKSLGERIVYLATCQPADREMRRRVLRHQQERSAHWRTIEHPPDLPKALTGLRGDVSGVVIDCLTMYVAHLLMRGRSDASIEQAVETLCRTIARLSYPVIMVTNEVGSGVVPPNRLGRRFRDLAGLANQTAARAADRVYVLTAGIPTLIKSALRTEPRALSLKAGGSSKLRKNPWVTRDR
ncbi:MAG: bifunctional adenosylcobinamide kinase/adenosylcobinamide-phosphate guanylyltransferase [Candidatus Omnitrophota bacterium]|nr:bifunctional adenosylcobinamide kinase/adenosylcobinamide-phosphate guanylyltransferase [Candidatus Omnitrophota bacterium]